MDTSVQELQTEFRTVVDELQVRVKELRDLREQMEQERAQFGEGLGETKTQMEKIEQRIKDLQKEQEQIRLDVNKPRLSTEEADKLTQDAQIRAFFKALRYGLGRGEKPSKEELATLYPDNRTYCNPVDPGDSRAFLKPEQARALVEDSTGEILVPEGLISEIIRTVEETAIIRPLADVMTTTSNREKYRSSTEVSVAYGQSLEEGGSVTESTPTPSSAYQYIEDMYGLVKIGENELMDSDYELLSFITDSFARAKRETEDTKFLTGAGHSSHEPEGLTNGTTITRVTAASATAITFDDILELMYGYESSSSTPLKDVYRRNGVYIMHPFTELAVMKLQDANNQYLWQASTQAGVPNRIWGHDVYTTTALSQIAASNDTVIFGDIKSTYRIIDRAGMKVQRLNELYITAGLIGFLFKMRNTGGIVRAEGARILQQAAV